MPEIMVFKEMIHDLGVPFTALPEEQGKWQNGEFIITVSPQPVDMLGIILPLSEDDLRYAENGTYSVKDRKIFTTITLQKGQKIRYKDVPYTIQNFKDLSDFTDVYIYLARWSGNESTSN